MRYLIVFIFVLSVIIPCFADCVSIQKSTGEIIEYQSSGNIETMTENAINLGYNKSDLNVSKITPEEWGNIRYEKIEKPYQDNLTEKNINLQQKLKILKQKLNLTDIDLVTLKQALGR